MIREVLEGISEFILTVMCLIVMVLFLTIAGICELLGGIFEDEN